MRQSRWHLGKGPARCGLALAAGFFLGGLLAHPRVGPGPEVSGHTSPKSSKHTGDSTPERRPSKTQRNAADEADFSLSPLQWSRFVRKPADFAVRMEDCLPVFGYDELPPGHPAVIRTVLGSPHAAMERMVDLQAELFGWEREKVWTIRTALLDFGKEIAEAERSGARIDYPEPGLIRFDLTQAREARAVAAANLKKRLEELAGKDAERLIQLMNVEGISRKITDHYDITAREDGGDLRITGSGVTDLIPNSERIGAEDFAPEKIQGRFDGRVLHLLNGVDWSRLNPATEITKP